MSVGLYSVPSPPTKSLQPRGGSYSWLGQPSTGTPPGLCLKPDLRGRTGVDEGAAAVMAGGTGPASFWMSRPCIREPKLTLCQDLGSLQHQRCSSRREGLQKRAHLALQSGRGREGASLHGPSSWDPEVTFSGSLVSFLPQRVSPRCAGALTHSLVPSSCTCPPCSPFPYCPHGQPPAHTKQTTGPARPVASHPTVRTQHS